MSGKRALARRTRFPLSKLAPRALWASRMWLDSVERMGRKRRARTSMVARSCTGTPKLFRKASDFSSAVQRSFGLVVAHRTLELQMTSNMRKVRKIARFKPLSAKKIFRISARITTTIMGLSPRSTYLKGTLDKTMRKTRQARQRIRPVKSEAKKTRIKYTSRPKSLVRGSSECKGLEMG